MLAIASQAARGETHGDRGPSLPLVTIYFEKLADLSQFSPTPTPPHPVPNFWLASIPFHLCQEE